MSNPTWDGHLGAPDPNFMPTTVAALYADIDQRLSVALTSGNYAPPVIGASTPAVGDQDKVWIKTDGAGRPIGTFLFYSGNWRRVYRASLGDVKMFSGNPSGLFDGTGLGILGTEQDGWALMNGSNGTPDWSNLFVAAANMNNTGGAGQYSSGWQSFVDGYSVKKTGGVATITLNAGNTYRPSTPAVHVDNWTADGNARSPTGPLFGVVGGGGTNTVLVAADAGVPTPPAIETCSPFIAAAFCQFIGYA